MTKTELKQRLEEGEALSDLLPFEPGPACEGTGPDCLVPCPGVAQCPLCKKEDNKK